VWELTFGGHLSRLREVIAERPELARIEGGGHTPLMWLPTVDESLAIEIAKLLIANGANAAKVNNDGQTAEERARNIAMYDLAAVLHDAAA
jgi:hypothetical protein